jgi:hypothetical protein
MAQIIAHRTKSASAAVASSVNWFRLLPEAFVHTIERLAIGK